jgi:hypothetical protein
MQAKLMQLIFEQVKEVILKFKFNLLPYTNKRNYSKKTGTEIKEFHYYNLVNICDVLIALVSYTDAVDEQNRENQMLGTFNSEIKNESRNRIEEIFNNLIGRDGNAYPEFTNFEHLVSHSFEHESIQMNLKLADFVQLYGIINSNLVEVFEREDPTHDYLYSQLQEIDTFDIKQIEEMGKTTKTQVIF